MVKVQNLLIMTTEEMIERLRKTGDRFTPAGLYVLEKRGYLPPRLHRGHGRWRQANVWSADHLRALRAYARLRRRGLHGRQFAFAYWWSTGRDTPGARRFLAQILGIVGGPLDSLGHLLDTLGLPVTPRSPRERLSLAMDQMADEAAFREQFLTAVSHNGLRGEAEELYFHITAALATRQPLPPSAVDPDTVREEFTPVVMGLLGFIMPAFLPYLKAETLQAALRDLSGPDLAACRRIARGIIALLFARAATLDPSDAVSSRRHAVNRMRWAARGATQSFLSTMNARETRRLRAHLLDTPEGRRALLVLWCVAVRQFIVDHWDGDWTVHLTRAFQGEREVKTIPL